jgi:hypothetical protein
MDQDTEGKQPTIVITEIQLKHIVQSVVTTKKKEPEKNIVAVMGDGWKYKFAIILDKSAVTNGN